MSIKDNALQLALALIRREASEMRLTEVRETEYTTPSGYERVEPPPCSSNDLFTVATQLEDLSHLDTQQAIAQDIALGMVASVPIKERGPAIFHFLDFVYRHGAPPSWSTDMRMVEQALTNADSTLSADQREQLHDLIDRLRRHFSERRGR